MKLAVAFMVLSAFAIPSRTAAQTTEPDQPPAVERPVSWKLLLPNLVSDQKRIWSSPARLVQGQGWIPTAAVLGTTAALLTLDPTEAAYFRRTATFHGSNNILTSNATAIGMIATPFSLYTIGLIRKDSKMQQTALLAGEAVADAEVLATILKDATSRVRPAGIPAGGNFSDSWFEGGSRFRGKGSFPSGHTIAAFSVATVISRRYGNHRWVPYAAYGMSALVGFSRLSLSSHFLSDVFMGGALGYSISRFTVLRQ
jgi:membrane-associated phospholipid phosphatase